MSWRPRRQVIVATLAFYLLCGLAVVTLIVMAWAELVTK